MKRVKRYPLLRQHAFDEGDSSDNPTNSPPLEQEALERVEKMYMINPDLICIFNTSNLPEKKMLRSLKRHKSEETSRSSCVVVGGSFIFSNSFDGYISPTLIEKYRALLDRRTSGEEISDKENLSNNICVEAQENEDMEPPQSDGDKDIVVFCATPVGNLEKPLSQKPRSQNHPSFSEPFISFSEPFVSPRKKDVISFFLTEVGRQKSLDEEIRTEAVPTVPTQMIGEPTQTIGEPTPEYSTTERDNDDIISFSATPQIEDNSVNIPAPSTKVDQNLRKPYVSLNYSDIISFYQNENSLLKAYETEVPQENGLDSSEQRDENMADIVVEVEQEKYDHLDKSDVHIFYNDQSAATVTTSTPKRSEKHSKPNIPLVLNKDSIVTFFSNESSFLAAVDANLSGVVVGKDFPLEDIDVTDNVDPDKVQDDLVPDVLVQDFDIKVFSNRTSEQKKNPNKTTKNRSDSPVLVVTQEFPDIISFYNPNVINEPTSGDISRPTGKLPIPLRQGACDSDLPKSIPMPIIGNGDILPYCMDEGDVYVEPPRHQTCPIEYIGSTMWERPKEHILDLDPPTMLVPQNTRERLITPNMVKSTVFEEEPTECPEFDDMPGLEESDDDVSSRHNSSVVIEDSHSEDGTRVRAIQDIENLPDIEKAINMIDAIKDLEIEELDVCVPEPIIDDYDDEDFELDITDDIESFLSESERFTPITMNIDTASEDAAYVERFFDDLDDPEEFLLKAHPDIDGLKGIETKQDTEHYIETPRSGDSESAIIEFITQNIEKYMDSSPVETASNGQGVPFQEASINVTDINDVIADADLAIAGIDDIITDDGSIVLPGCATPTPGRANCHESDADSDVEYKTMFEALNKPLLPPILKSEEDDECGLETSEDECPFLDRVKSLTYLGEYRYCLGYEEEGARLKKLEEKERLPSSLQRVLSRSLLSEIIQHPLTSPTDSGRKHAVLQTSPSKDPGTLPPGTLPLGHTGAVSEDKCQEVKDCIANAIDAVLYLVSNEPVTKSPTKEPLSPRSNLAKSILERINSSSNTASNKKVPCKAIKPSDVVKLDKKLFSELQRKFSKPKEKMSSFRSKNRNNKTRTRKWIPVQVVPDQVISYNQVNAVDVEVYIPDIIERRTPIARLFNDTTPPKKGSSSPGLSVSSPPARIISPKPNVFVPIDIPMTPLKRRFPSPKILRKVALFEGLAMVDSKRRPVSPGPESKYLGSLDNLSDNNTSHECECEAHPNLAQQSRYWASQETGIYDGTLKPANQRRAQEMFQPSWRRGSPEAEDRPRSTSPHWRSFSEAALGVTGVNGTFEGHVPSPSSRPLSRTRILSYESGREENLLKNSIGSQTNTHVDRLARSGSAASLAVVMASTFPNGGDANFDLEGTAHKINEVCKTFSSSQHDISSCGVNITRSRSMNSSINVIHSPDVKTSGARPLYFGSRTTANIRIRTTPEKRVCQPIRATRPSPSYRQIKELQEKLKSVKEICYADLIACPRNRLPSHVDKLQLQNCLSDTEFVDVFKMEKDDFKRLAPWKQAHLKKEVLLF